MCNCGCDPAWATSPAGDPAGPQGKGCVTGGGTFGPKAYSCTNYWRPTDLDNQTHAPTDPTCANASRSTLACGGNLTQKILGDDSMEIMDRFEDFSRGRRRAGTSASTR